MKISAFSLLAVIGVASAGKPSISLTVSDGCFAGLDGLDPSISWSGETSSGDVDLEYGVDLAVKPTTDLASLPKKIWGKATTEVSGWTTSVTADVEGTDFENTQYTVDAENGDLSIKLSASGGGVHKVEATQSFDSNGATVTVNPRYNIDTEEADVVINYEVDDTTVELTASAEAQSVVIGHVSGDTSLELTASAESQSLTITQQIDADNKLSPTITSDGDISLEWERQLGDGNSLSATVKPNESIDVEWNDADWTANINVPIDGTTVTGANVSIKRDVSF